MWDRPACYMLFVAARHVPSALVLLAALHREVVSVKAILRRGGSLSEQSEDRSGDNAAYKPLIW